MRLFKEDEIKVWRVDVHKRKILWVCPSCGNHNHLDIPLGILDELKKVKDPREMECLVCPAVIARTGKTWKLKDAGDGNKEVGK